MTATTYESRSMGRPKKGIGTTSMRIDDDAYDLARKASGFTGESLIQYVSRVVREQAEKDVRIGAEEFLRLSDQKARDKPPKR
jgi:uncharacterized protein (DUF1778 family)